MKTTLCSLALATALALATNPALASTEPEDVYSDDAADAELTDEAIYQFMATDTVVGVSGERATLADGVVLVDVPADYRLLDAVDTQRLLELYWSNEEDTTVLASLVPAADTLMADVTTAYVIYYEALGHVSDEDAADLDADEMLSYIREKESEANEQRREMGYPESEILGWVKAPAYDKENRVVSWAKNMRFTYEGVANDVMNYEVRILGRYGSITILAVGDTRDVIAGGDALARRFAFADGFRYEDYNALTDGDSDMSIGGLVLGGTLLAKTGILAKIGLFLAKAWKLIAVAVVAIGGIVAKVMGKKKKEEGEK